MLAYRPGAAQKVGNLHAQLGFKLAKTEHGDLNISIYSYARYLNQRALEPTYTKHSASRRPFNSARTSN